MTTPVPVVDLQPWIHGTADDRAAVAHRVDDALCTSGFLLVTGHEVPGAVRAAARSAARQFFAMPTAVKDAYAVGVGGRGWLPPGAEANAGAEGVATPPDLKESWSCGADTPTGDPEVDAVWFAPNVWPHEVPALRPALEEHLAHMRTLADELLVIGARALGLEEDFFTRRTRHPSYTLNVNRYPPLTETGEPADGQFRIGAHTDFGTVTVLDREVGAGGLQVDVPGLGWVDAPHHPGAFTINIGDLLARWTGERWRSTRHRVLPPQDVAPDEDLVSLVYFYELDPDTTVEALGPPVGHVAAAPVRAREYLAAKLAAITVQ
ncbi:oxidoreductase [Actinomycetospora sp. NBRC 106375]|uniref:isopenicillin N synthase family dioxygenase n=1 Tax=Actinomycetospora sp. NBRC 106375 TaxID=3032207 RepID=UPI0024A347D1|nr:2-oxoglutarate and iron-dependent oxygenase domain-containing protein [Actinomycetospora sp. NBRC 106375]GLZ44887.1 oxidoreductase [Actinomycetospora sp. NBRC 106375]